MLVARVQPLAKVMNETRRRRDDYEWEGEFDKAKLEDEYLKHLKQQEERGELWEPNFQVICGQHLFTGLLCGCYMLGSQADAPFDDCTHWVGSLRKTSSSSTKRTDKRTPWWQFKPDILSKELGVAQKQQAKHSMANRYFAR